MADVLERDREDSWDVGGCTVNMMGFVLRVCYDVALAQGIRLWPHTHTHTQEPLSVYNS